MMRAALAALLTLLLVWRGGVSLVQVAREGVTDLGKTVDAVRLSEEERVARALDESDAELDLPESFQNELLLLCRTEVPLDGHVYVVSPRWPKSAYVFRHLVPLLYPRRVEWIEGLPSNWPRPGFDVTDRIFVLELNRRSGLGDAAPWFRQVASGELFALWRCRGERP